MVPLSQRSPPLNLSVIVRRLFVPCTQVVALLKSGRFDLSPTEATQLLATFSIDEGGAVDYYEWVAALMDWREVGELLNQK